MSIFASIPYLVLAHRNLTSRGVKGELPANLGPLDDLTVLDLSDNSFSGELPKTLGRLGNLRVL